jgi:D-glycero-D-manno-heptose 1,7-bisphosphate phosphatase
VFEELMVWMRGELRREGVELDAVYFCPFHPEHGMGKYKREHEDRKPGIGMLRRGAKEFGLELSASVLVGDRCSDIAAANAAGLRQAFLIAGTEEGGRCGGNFIDVMGLDEVEAWLVKQG